MTSFLAVGKIHGKSESIYFQGDYFEPRAGGEVRIQVFGFYNNKRTNQKKGGYDKYRKRQVVIILML